MCNKKCTMIRNSYEREVFSRCFVTINVDILSREAIRRKCLNQNSIFSGLTNLIKYPFRCSVSYSKVLLLFNLH